MYEIIEKAIKSVKLIMPELLETNCRCLFCASKITNWDFYDNDYFEKDNEIFCCADCYNEYIESTCVHCDCHVPFSQIEKIKNEIYCSSCAEELFFECYNCEQTHSKSDVRSNEICDSYNEYVTICENCDDNTYYCVSCQNTFLDEDKHSRIENGDFYCHDCQDDLLYCDHCNEHFHQDSFYISDDYTTICENCRDNYYVCDDCDSICDIDFAFFSENDESCYCESCYIDNGHSDDYENILTYGDAPDLHFQKCKNEKPAFYMGFELEVACKNAGDSFLENMAETITDTYGHYCMEDSSIKENPNGYEGFEIISHPFSWNYYQENTSDLNNMLSDLKENDFISYDAFSCGMHIHISKKAFSTLHLYKFLKLFYENLDFIQIISQRTKKSSAMECQWHKSKEEVTKEDIKKYSKSKTCKERYTGINLKPSETIEIRIFRGTLDKISFHKNFEFVKALYDYTLNASINNITVKNFITYIYNNKNTFKNLFSFLEKNREKIQCV